MLRHALVVVGAVALTIGLGGTATADSPLVSASSGQCWAQWYSSSNLFGISDNDLQDNDYCYVQYGWSSGSQPNRVSRPEDVGGWGYYGVTVEGSTIWWKVCKERQNDPDICSSVRSDLA